MAEYRHGATLQRGDVVVCGDGLIRTVIKNQNEVIWWTLGGLDGGRIIAHESGNTLRLEQISHDAMRAGMLVLASIE